MKIKKIRSLLPVIVICMLAFVVPTYADEINKGVEIQLIDSGNLASPLADPAASCSDEKTYRMSSLLKDFDVTINLKVTGAYSSVEKWASISDVKVTVSGPSKAQCLYTVSTGKNPKTVTIKSKDGEYKGKIVISLSTNGKFSYVTEEN